MHLLRVVQPCMMDGVWCVGMASLPHLASSLCQSVDRGVRDVAESRAGRKRHHRFFVR